MDSLLPQAPPTRYTYQPQAQQRLARDTQSWTPTRCHRLLRPLKTHVFALRREMELESEGVCGDDARNENSATDAAPRFKRGRIQHTYSRRGRKPVAEASSDASQPREPQNASISKTMKLSGKKALHPGEIALPTPVLRRARHRFASPISQPVLTGRTPKLEEKRPDCIALQVSGILGRLKPSSTYVVSALEIEMLPLRYQISSVRFSLYQSILRALHALLLATVVSTPVTQSSTTSHSATSNTKSLMAMCLRKVPEYIGELEYWEQREAEENGTKSTLQSSELSNQVYEAVEDMLPSSRGCHQLRTVVREHAMKVVRDAIAQRLLDEHFSLILVALCFRMKAYLEAEGLLEAILFRPYPRPKSVESTFDESRKLAPLKILCDLARETGRTQFMLRQLSKLMKSQQLPLDWLSTKQFASIWSGIVKTLSGDAVCDETVSCAVHMMTLLSIQAKSPAFTLRPGKDDLKSLSQQTLVSAITAFTSLALLRQAAGAGSAYYSAQNTSCAISARVTYIVNACMYEMKRTRKSGWISTVLSISAYFTSTTQGRLATDVSEFWHRVLQDCNRRDGKQHYEAATAVLCSLARCCGQGAAEPSHYYLTKLCDQLDSTASIEDEKSRQLRTDCAFFLAERTNDMRDLAFAESFNNNTNTSRGESRAGKHTRKKRSSTSAATGFRWDGDISEWVTATPAPRSRRASTQTQGLSLESTDETCRDETDGDSGVSDFEATSAKHHGFYKNAPKQWTRSAATRASRFVPKKQGSASLTPMMRKRKSAFAGLLSLLPSDDEAETEEEEEEKESDVCPPQPRGSSRPQPVNGQENRIGVVYVTDAAKRRRVEEILKPRRAILRTLTNRGHEDLSDDELGL